MSHPVLPPSRPPAITLFALAVLTLFVMLHHPTIGAHGTAEALAEIQHEQGLNMLVHGAMILFVLLYHWCFGVLSEHLVPARPSVALAQLALHVGVAGYVGAALISGFAVPELAGHVEATDEGVRTALRSLHAINQVLANLGTVAFGAAIALWGAALLLLRPPAVGPTRVVGIIGVLTGVAMIVGLTFGFWSLDVAGMTLVVLLLGLWSCAAAVWLLAQARTGSR